MKISSDNVSKPLFAMLTIIITHNVVYPFHPPVQPINLCFNVCTDNIQWASVERGMMNATYIEIWDLMHISYLAKQEQPVLQCTCTISIIKGNYRQFHTTEENVQIEIDTVTLYWSTSTDAEVNHRSDT